MKKAVAFLLVLACMAAMSSCGFSKKIYFSEEKYSENLSRDVSEYEAEQSKLAEKKEKAISEVAEKVGKSVKNKTFCYKLTYPTYIEYSVVTFKSGKAKSKDIYRFFESPSRYERQLGRGDSGTEKLVGHDDDVQMLRYKETEFPDWDWDYYVEKYEDRSEELCSILR